MDLLLKRAQNRNWRRRVVFRLWAKIEMDEDERALIERYSFEESILISEDDFEHLKAAVIMGFLGCLVFTGLVFALTEVLPAALGIGLVAGLITGIVWLNEKRETIYVRDLIYGRRFKCRSIVELAHKESMLDDACLAFRQIVETAKHWDGVETRPVEVLSPEDAKAVVARLY